MSALRRPRVPRLAIVFAVLLIGGSASSVRALPTAQPLCDVEIHCATGFDNAVCRQCRTDGKGWDCCVKLDPSVSCPTFTCEVHDAPPDAPFLDIVGKISIVHMFSGLKLEYSRKEIVSGDQLLATFKLKGELRLPGLPTRRIDVRGTLSGEDASVGSLAYAVGFIGGGEAALGQLQAQGKDLSLQMTGPPVTCQSSFGTANCNVLAQQMAGLISAALPEGSAAQDSFIESIEPLGYASCGEYVGNDIDADTKGSAPMSRDPASASALLD